MALFIVQNFKKLLQRIRGYEDAPFLGPKWSTCPKQTFFWKIINIILIYLPIIPFNWAKLKKNLPVDPELWGCAIFGPRMAHFPKWELFSENLLMSLVSFIHAYLQAKNQSLNINLLVKYWWLKNTEISLAQSHFWLWFENQIFPKHVVFAECWWNIKTFILHKFQTKLMMWFS